MHPGLLRIRDRPGRTLRINNSGRLTGTSDMSGVREPRPARGCTQNAIWYLSAFRSGLEACVDEPLAMHDPIVIAFHVEELDAIPRRTLGRWRSDECRWAEPIGTSRPANRRSRSLWMRSISSAYG